MWSIVGQSFLVFHYIANVYSVISNSAVLFGKLQSDAMCNVVRCGSVGFGEVVKGSLVQWGCGSV